MLSVGEISIPNAPGSVERLNGDQVISQTRFAVKDDQHPPRRCFEAENSAVTFPMVKMIPPKYFRYRLEAGVKQTPN
jgi:hypothetical protein